MIARPGSAVVEKDNWITRYTFFIWVHLAGFAPHHSSSNQGCPHFGIKADFGSLAIPIDLVGGRWKPRPMNGALTREGAVAEVLNKLMVLDSRSSNEH